MIGLTPAAATPGPNVPHPSAASGASTPVSSSTSSASSARVDATVASLAALVDRFALQPDIDRARDACTQVRWHEALRRRTAEVAAESRVRGAWASARLDGARCGLDEVRDLLLGSQALIGGSAAIHEVVLGAARATAEVQVLRGRPVAPAQVLARLHAAAVGDADDAGRPRSGPVDEFPELGAAPTGVEVTARLRGIADLLAARGQAPGLVVGAIAHAEIALVRPFGSRNAVVARAVERFVVHDSGLDPTGVTAPELGHAVIGMTAYHGALAGYASGAPEGVALWVRHCADAMVAAAVEASRVADAVRRGSLAGSELEK